MQALKTVALLLFAGSLSASAAIVNAGSLSLFAGPGGLDLSATIVYAVNVGRASYGVGELAEHTVNGVPFQAEDGYGAAWTVTGVVATDWGVKPSYGASADADHLENVMHSIRYGEVEAGPKDVTITSSVVPGQRYRLQLFFAENYWGNGGPPDTERRFDIHVEGAVVVAQLWVAQEQADGGSVGTNLNPPINGLLYTYDFVALDAELNLVLQSGTGFADPNPILQAFLLASIPEPATLGLLALGGLTLLRRRR